MKRAYDALRGVWLGDAFGETWFFRADAAQAMPARRLRAGVWKWTDDTAMAVSVFKVLNTFGSIEQDALATEFADAYAADPHRNYGGAMHGVLTEIGAGAPWRDVAARQFGGQGSWGNGAAMRVAPVGAWFSDDLDEVVVQAARSAEVTHAHPEASAGAIAVAVATALNVRGAPLGTVVDRVPDGEVAAGLRRAAEIPFTAGPVEAAAILGCGERISAPDTVPFAVWCAARHPDDLVEALWATASAGGDVDTTCAIVGGIVAARTGLAEVPQEWLTRAEPLPGHSDVPCNEVEAGQ
jgi:ADP-ribosylglycohydrolase